MIKILMIDDHPTQIDGYKAVLSFNELGLEIETTACYTCESAYNVITNIQTPSTFDVVFLDRSLPPYSEKNIQSGEDLAPLIRKHLPSAKIVVLTSHCESVIIYNINKIVNPEGLLIKSDFTAEELLQMFAIVLNGGYYKSITVRECIDKVMCENNLLEGYNAQILILLAQGLKTQSISEHMGLSISAIEKRKTKLRDSFCVQGRSDEEIIREARKRGFI